MKVKELIKQLVDCDMEDDIYIAVITDNKDLIHYSIDGLDNSMYEYRNKPTLATLKVKKEGV